MQEQAGLVGFSPGSSSSYFDERIVWVMREDLLTSTPRPRTPFGRSRPAADASREVNRAVIPSS